MRTATGDKALRLFHSADVPMIARTKRITATLNSAKPAGTSLPLPQMRFVDRCVRIEGAEHPALVMDWVWGEPLNTFVAKHRNDPRLLHTARQSFVECIHRLWAEGWYAADPQHGNLLAHPTGRVWFIDPDDLVGPGLVVPSGFRGHPNYQHPRLMDEAVHPGWFAAQHIALSLEVMVLAPELIPDDPDWSADRECLLLDARDLAEPAPSKTLAAWRKHRNTRVREIANQLEAYLRMRPHEVPMPERVADFVEVPSRRGSGWFARIVEAWSIGFQSVKRSTT